MANDAGTPRKNRKRRRKRKKKMMMTAASLTTTAKTKDHPAAQLQGELNHVPIQPPPAAARNAGEGQQEDTPAADEAVAQRKEPPREQEQERAATATPTCCICGVARWHNEYFCAWNYMDGRVGATCRAGCVPSRHAAVAAASHRRRDALRRFVRVTNLPSSLGLRELDRLFQRFGPLLMSVITTTLAPPGSAGFGYVAFKEREHAEEAVDKLNGHHVGGRNLRVDWAYPRA
ncbi:hypothetical protein BDA96_10G029000 [Sorghum bicolor]|jgi:hypothetical protein|uniref:RRM domain-containing protein n=2 Tax=Sorghum bicolor TaxID=4558 RepID=A0A921TZG2_SORBI|nr:eukaryotic translation initiation factor 3 subunit G-B [Sorghum bicolor]KAG0512605.1 hypothetical protein BDA96_10G029000 [Sorghum bicolor]KXG19214.2 hypothetical protein SORBI_3010G024900 [Sorghum bicolor]|eukprot:XP_002436429.1 eukaryotic translation initiation factor 3 subunit G-B [Sorghum bicolor]